MCINVAGGSNCGCNSGYTLDDDGFTCNGKHKHVYHYEYHTYTCTSIHAYVHGYLLAKK